MDIQQLQYFIAAAEQGNFSKAARECFVVQSTISKQIGLLEEELGAELFTRGKRGNSLTDEGKYLLREARKIVALAERASEHINELKGIKRKIVKVGYYGTGVGEDTSSLVHNFYIHNHVKVEMLSSSIIRGELLDYLENGEIDMVITLEPVNKLERNYLKYRVLRQAKMKLVVSNNNPLALYEGDLTIQELNQLDKDILIVRPMESESVVNEGKNWLQQELAMESSKVHFVTDLLSMKIQIDADMAVGLFLETDFSCLNLENLSVIDVKGIEPMNICAVINKKMSSDETLLFYDYITAYYSNTE